MGRVFPPRILTHCVAQHADEAAFLWHIRDLARHAPHYNLSDLAHVDGRVEDHLQGLRIAGSDSLEICAENMGAGGPGAVFAATVLGLEFENPDMIATVARSAGESPSAGRQFASALGWAKRTVAERFAGQHLGRATDPLRSYALRAMALRRVDPGRCLADAICDPDESVMIAGLRSAGELGRIDLLPGIALNYEHTSSEVRCWALWSGGLLGDEKAAADLPQLLSRPAIHPIVRGLISRILDYRGAVAIIDNLASCPTTARWAAIAIGHAGYADLIPLAISLMHLEPVARVAGEAVYAITGIDLSHERMEKEPASDFSAGPTEHADDANVALDPDENLPWPDKTQIEYWWKEHSGQFSQGVRYLLGRPMTENWLQTVLQDGRQRQRSGSALELAIRRRGKPLFNVSAPGFRQQRLIALGS